LILLLAGVKRYRFGEMSPLGRVAFAVAVGVAVCV
jgi:hypothetical protein